MFNTDMADERIDEYKYVHNLSDVDGLQEIKDSYDDFSVVRVNVLDENGSKAIEKEIGTYITYEIKDVNYIEDDNKEKLVETLSKEISAFIEPNDKIMVVGLGNIYVVADALGNSVVKNINVTRYLKNIKLDFNVESIREVSAICPGVMGNTGIETVEIINAVSKIVNPDCIIVIDSLVTSSVNRVGASIQLSNRGITPGSGISNINKKIDSSSKIISIGVPMALDISSMVNEIKEKYILTPKDVDFTLQTMSNIISESINKAM